MISRRHSTVQPRIAGKRTPHGMLIVHNVDTGRHLATAVVLGLICAGIVAAGVAGMQRGSFDGRIIWLVTMVWGLATAAGHRYLVALRIRRGSLLVTPWPIRLGQDVQLKFRARLSTASPVQEVKAWLRCVENAGSGGGRSRVVRSETIFECELPAAIHPAGERTIDAEWKTQVPATLPPSIAIEDNMIRWWISAGPRVDDMWAAVDFELLVLPEVMSD